MLARMGFLTEISGPQVTADLPAQWIFDRLEEWAQQFPNQLAFAIDRRDGVEEHRYADVLDHVNAVEIEFQQHGIDRGDKVGILMENIPQWVFVLLAAMKMGAVTVPLATTLPENSLRLIAQHAGCRMIVADEQNWEKADRLCRELKCTLGSPFGSGRAVSQTADGPGEGTGFAKVRGPPPGVSAGLPPGGGGGTACIVAHSGPAGTPQRGE